MESNLTDPVAALAAQGPSPESVSGSALGRNEFLALFIAKLENQDPLQPTADTEFVSQLATFSSLEQLLDVNQNLQTLALGQANLINSQALGLIGQEALVEGGDRVRIKDGRPDTIVYAVPEQAGSVTLTISDKDGVPVRTFELETSPQGRVTLDWDGTDEDGNPLADGEYTLQVRATAPNGDPMSIALFRSLRIDGVNFATGAVALISGDREIPFDQILEIRAARSD